MQWSLIRFRLLKTLRTPILVYCLRVCFGSQDSYRMAETYCRNYLFVSIYRFCKPQSKMSMRNAYNVLSAWVALLFYHRVHCWMDDCMFTWIVSESSSVHLGSAFPRIIVRYDGAVQSTNQNIIVGDSPVRITHLSLHLYSYKFARSEIHKDKPLKMESVPRKRLLASHRLGYAPSLLRLL